MQRSLSDSSIAYLRRNNEELDRGRCRREFKEKEKLKQRRQWWKWVEGMTSMEQAKHVLCAVLTLSAIVLAGGIVFERLESMISPA